MELSLLCIYQEKHWNKHAPDLHPSGIDPALCKCHLAGKEAHRGERVCLGGGGLPTKSPQPHSTTSSSRSPLLSLQPLTRCCGSAMMAIKDGRTPQNWGAAQFKIPRLTPGVGWGVCAEAPSSGRGLASPSPAACLSFPIASLLCPEAQGCSVHRSASSPTPAHVYPCSSCPSKIQVRSLPSPPACMSHGEPQLLCIPPHPSSPPPHGSALFCFLLMGVTIYNFWREATTPKKK